MNTPASRRFLPAGVILWPAFIAAVAGCALFFIVCAPGDLVRMLGIRQDPGAVAVYSVAFLSVWAVCSLSSGLTWLLMRPAGSPPGHLDVDVLS